MKCKYILSIYNYNYFQIFKADAAKQCETTSSIRNPIDFVIGDGSAKFTKTRKTHPHKR